VRGEEEYTENFGAETEGRNSFEGLGLEVRMSLTWIVNKYCGMAWTSFIWLGIGKEAGTVSRRMNSRVEYYRTKSLPNNEPGIFSRKTAMD
jgi:hypothetical protein